jgi:hypothetical protein
MDEKTVALTPNPFLVIPKIGPVIKSAMFRAKFYGPTFDELKREIFFRPVYWHANEINDSWARASNDALRTLMTCLGSSANAGGPSKWFRISQMIVAFFLVANELWIYRVRLLQRLGQALHGDRDAAGRIWRRIKHKAGEVFAMQRPRRNLSK